MKKELTSTLNGLVWFYGISTIVGYLMPDPVFTYMLNIWFVNAFSWCIFIHAWAHFFCSQLNVFKYCYLIWIILFNINHLFAFPVKWLQVLIIHHHYLVVPSAQISLIFSRHPSLSFIASGRSPGLHPISSPSCCM